MREQIRKIIAEAKRANPARDRLAATSRSSTPSAALAAHAIRMARMAALTHAEHARAALDGELSPTPPPEGGS